MARGTGSTVDVKDPAANAATGKAANAATGKAANAATGTAAEKTPATGKTPKAAPHRHRPCPAPFDGTQPDANTPANRRPEPTGRRV